MKRVIVGFLVGAWLTVGAAPAQASLWDGDAAVVSQLIALLEQARQTRDAIQKEYDLVKSHVEYSRTVLGKLRNSEFMEGLRILQEGEQRLNHLRQTDTRIGWRIDEVDRSFEALFGRKLSTLSKADLARLKKDMRDEKKKTAKNATVNQASAVATAERNSQRLRTIMETVQTTQGVVGQQQASNQLLSQLSDQMSALLVMLSTTNRLLAHEQAEAAERENVQDEKTRRRLQRSSAATQTSKGVKLP